MPYDWIVALTGTYYSAQCYFLMIIERLSDNTVYGSYINNRDIVYKRPPVIPLMLWFFRGSFKTLPTNMQDAVQPATNPYV